MKFILFFSILVSFSGHLRGQPGKDSNNMIKLSPDGGRMLKYDSTPSHRPHFFMPRQGIEALLSQNKLINLAQPLSMISTEKQQAGKEFIFYFIASVCLLTGMLKIFYARYFNTIFRVYFNTSLRQNQLTDLLLQAKLPSLIFNILFFINGSLYSSLLISHYHLNRGRFGVLLILSAFVVLVLIYIGKYLALKFVGWVTGMKTEAETYIFIVFLINKILGVLLLPFIILLAFSSQGWQGTLILCSLIMIALLFLSRYFRSYDLLQHKLMINRFHFLLYIISFEIFPVIILAKVAEKMLTG